MKVANLQRMGSFPAVISNRASRRDFARQSNTFNEITRLNAQRTESAKGKEQIIFRMRASEIERKAKEKPIIVEMPKPSVFYSLKRVAVILLSIVGLAIAGETMGQTYDWNVIRDPIEVRRVLNDYSKVPEEKRVYGDIDVNLDIAFTNRLRGAKDDVSTAKEHAIIRQAFEQKVDPRVLAGKVGKARERERSNIGFMMVWAWYLENNPLRVAGKVSEAEFTNQLYHQIEINLKDFLKPQQQKQPEQPVAVKLTLGQ